MNVREFQAVTEKNRFEAFFDRLLRVKTKVFEIDISAAYTRSREVASCAIEPFMRIGGARRLRGINDFPIPKRRRDDQAILVSVSINFFRGDYDNIHGGVGSVKPFIDCLGGSTAMIIAGLDYKKIHIAMRSHFAPAADPNKMIFSGFAAPTMRRIKIFENSRIERLAMFHELTSSPQTPHQSRRRHPWRRRPAGKAELRGRRLGQRAGPLHETRFAGC